MSENSFNINDEFFVITPDNLDTIKTKLYGFIIADNGIIENENINLLQDMSGAGAYVYVKKVGQTITVHRDINGSYGLFLFKQGDWFALSNSFFLLVEYLKDKFKLEFNQDFANYMLAMDLVSEALEDTWIKQITLLDKDAIVNIDLATSKLTTELANWGVHSIPIDSAQGVAILDKWFVRWTRLLRNLQSKTNNISTDLSGGFDSRMTFCLALMSGIDLNKIRINSLLPTANQRYAEDFEIASSIAECFMFGLNGSLRNSCGNNFKISDILNMNIYSRLPFHKQAEYSWVSYKRKNKQYNLSGDGGELFRNYWNGTINEHFQDYLKSTARRYPSHVLDAVTKSVQIIANKTIEKLAAKYNIGDKNSHYMSRLLYMNTRSSRHAGGMAVLIKSVNVYRLEPLLDPEILKLELTNAGCPNDGLFLAMVLSRYCPKLLDFKFEGGRSINLKTIEYAKQINAKFPVNMVALLSREYDDQYSIITEDDSVSDDPNHNERISDTQMEELLVSVYKSDAFKYFITKYFDESVYDYAKQSGSLLHIHPLLVAAILLKITEGCLSPFDWLKTFE